MAGAAKATTDHEFIRRWAEERGGRPARVKGTGDGGDPGMLRIDFPGYAEESLEEISWEDWFAKFEEKNLAFLYQERTDGGISRFFKLVDRGSVEEGRKAA
jgi:hypothetical protein